MYTQSLCCCYPVIFLGSAILTTAQTHPKRENLFKRRLRHSTVAGVIQKYFSVTLNVTSHGISRPSYDNMMALQSTIWFINAKTRNVVIKLSTERDLIPPSVNI